MSLVSKHTFVLSGRKTSIGIEHEFWENLREIAVKRGQTIGGSSRRLTLTENWQISLQLFERLFFVIIATSSLKEPLSRLR